MSKKINIKLNRQPQQIRTTRPSAFGNRPRGLSRKKKKKVYKRQEEVEAITEVTIPQECRVYEFAEKCGKTTSEVISTLFMLGMMVKLKIMTYQSWMLQCLNSSENDIVSVSCRWD